MRQADISRAELEGAEQTLKAAQASLKSAQANVQAAQGNVASARYQYSLYHILSLHPEKKMSFSYR